MLKFLLCMLCTFCFSSISARQAFLPLVIQFDNTTARCTNGDLISGCAAFNRSPEIGPFFEMLKEEYQITTVIETGTYQGSTTAFFARVFDEVHTIDSSPNFLNQSKNALSALQNIQYHLGSSERVLSEILPGLKDRFILFYLDAHWEQYWPLLDELEVINRTHHQRCVVVIDDIKVPGRHDVPYDYYGNKECSFEFAKEKIEKIFDRYEMHYLVPANPAMRAKLVIMPK